jgi:insulysin
MWRGRVCTVFLVVVYFVSRVFSWSNQATRSSRCRHFSASNDNDNGDCQCSGGSDNGEKYTASSLLDKSRRSILSRGIGLASGLYSGIELPLYNAHAQEQTAPATTTNSPTLSSTFADTGRIIIPYSSIRRYKTITLNNGMSVILVSDQRASTANLALTVGGAGQWADPFQLPGLAHLMEHMILSILIDSSKLSTSKSATKSLRDFEDWVADQEGASNGFTAYDSVTFHFTCPDIVLNEALERFAQLFIQSNVEDYCRRDFIVKREIRRVDSELDFDSELTQAAYLSKDFVNFEHPYSRFSAGSLYTLERRPRLTGVDVGESLIDFFVKKYQAKDTVLVVIGRQDVSTLEKMVSPFAATMSRVIPDYPKQRYYPGAFLAGNRLKHIILYSGGMTSRDAKKMSFEWSFQFDYSSLNDASQSRVTATHVAFVMSQALCRRGPGSLYSFLKRRGWVANGTANIPRVSVPVDVSLFQIIKLDLSLTTEGVANRAGVLAAVYDCLKASFQTTPQSLARNMYEQYATLAKLHGYILAPRPPDAVELGMDAQVYGVDAVSKGDWYRFPSDPQSLQQLQQVIKDEVADKLLDPTQALVIVQAGNEEIRRSSASVSVNSIPPLTSQRWLVEPTTRARFCYDYMLPVQTRVEPVMLARLVAEQEILAPVFNPLIPAKLRLPRQEVTTAIVTTNANDLLVYNSTTIVLGSTGENKAALASSSAAVESDDTARRIRDGDDWILLDPGPGIVGISVPRSPPESSCRAVFVLQLLSPRPARANVRQAAQAELWKQSFELAGNDLAELGAPAGLSYDVSFNKFGLRIVFLGISQNIASYARRLSRILVRHSQTLLEGPEILAASITTAAVNNAKRARGISAARRQTLISSLRRSTAHEAAAEGLTFLASCSCAICFAQGDILYDEAASLMKELSEIFQPYVSGKVQGPTAAVPTIGDLTYAPTWKPRSASICAIPGIPLVCDACGRLPR